MTHGKVERPEYTLARVSTPTIKDGKLLVPLVPVGDVHMSATICATMLGNGYTWKEVKAIRGGTIGPGWTAKAVLNYVANRGPASFEEGTP